MQVVATTAAGEAELHADAELCVELRADLDAGADADAARVAIGQCLPALELVDLVARPDEPHAVIAENIFHRAVVFGRTPLPAQSADDVTVYVNDASIGRSPWPDDIPQRIAAGAELLGMVGQRLRAGDRIITGAIVQVPVAPGDRVLAHFGGYGQIGVEVFG